MGKIYTEDEVDSIKYITRIDAIGDVTVAIIELLAQRKGEATADDIAGVLHKMIADTQKGTV